MTEFSEPFVNKPGFGQRDILSRDFLVIFAEENNTITLTLLGLTTSPRVLLSLEWIKKQDEISHAIK